MVARTSTITTRIEYCILILPAGAPEVFAPESDGVLEFVKADVGTDALWWIELMFDNERDAVAVVVSTSIDKPSMSMLLTMAALLLKTAVAAANSDAWFSLTLLVTIIGESPVCVGAIVQVTGVVSTWVSTSSGTSEGIREVKAALAWISLARNDGLDITK